MFTGIIEEVGRVASIEEKGENRRITIEAAKTPGELRTGDSQRRLPDGAGYHSHQFRRRPCAGNLGAHLLLPHSA
jgi:hypothetical protein